MQRRAGLDRLLLALGHHAEKGAVAHHGDDALHDLHRRVVEMVELGAVARRTHHASVQHAGRPDILHEGDAAGDLGGNVQARDRSSDDAVACRGLRCDLGGGVALQVGLGGKLAITDLAAVGRAGNAVGKHEGIGADAEPPGGERGQHRAHLGGGHAQAGTTRLERHAAGGEAFIGGARGVAGDHPDPIEREIELLGRDLGERGEDPLPELDLAGEDRRAAVGIDADPGAEPAIALQAAGQTRRLLAARDVRAEGECDEDAAEAGGEFATVESGRIHDRLLPFAAAARSTARTIRLWVPQRQRLPASADRTCASVGRGLRSSSSLAAMIMPAVQ